LALSACLSTVCAALAAVSRLDNAAILFSIFYFPTSGEAPFDVPNFELSNVVIASCRRLCRIAISLKSFSFIQVRVASAILRK
jgi:hypothetical protein